MHARTLWWLLLGSLLLSAPAVAHAQGAQGQDALLQRFETALWGCALTTPVVVEIGGGRPTSVTAAADDRECVTTAIQGSLPGASFTTRSRLLAARSVEGLVTLRRETPAHTASIASQVRRDRALAPSTRGPDVELARDTGMGGALLWIAPAFLLGSGLLGLGGYFQMNPFCFYGCSGPPRDPDKAMSFGIGSGIFLVAAIALVAGGVELVSRRSPVRLASGPGDLGAGLAVSF